jgi:hypothetical protein
MNFDDTALWKMIQSDWNGRYKNPTYLISTVINAEYSILTNIKVNVLKVYVIKIHLKKKAASLWILSWVNNKIIPLIKRYMDFISLQKNDTRKKKFWSKDCV